MVVLGAVSLVYFLFNGLFGGLGSGNLGLNTLAQSVVGDSFFSGLAWANNYVPLTQAVAAFGVVLGFVLLALTIRLVLWVLRVLHVTGED